MENKIAPRLLESEKRRRSKAWMENSHYRKEDHAKTSNTALLAPNK